MVQASTFAAQVDWIFWFITYVSLFFLVLITVLMVVFAVRYHHKRHKTAEDIHGNLPLEIVWTVIPTILVLMMFWYGWDGFKVMRTPPADAMQITATGQMWSWNFTYPNQKQSAELYLAVNKPVKINLESKDVVHALFIPAFRVKEDVMPNHPNWLWFEPNQVGVYDIECAEYCGQRHAYMLSKVHVMPESEFDVWLAKSDGPLPGEAKGAVLYKSKGCVACHTTDGTPLVGPSFKGIFGRSESVVTGGAERTVVVDEAYLKKSMLDPAADVVKGFPPIMPPQKGLLTEEELNELVVYLKELN